LDTASPINRNGRVTTEAMADNGLKPPSQAGGAHAGMGHGGGQFGMHFMGPGPDIMGAPGGGIMGLPDAIIGMGRATGTFTGGHMPVGPH
jgi:hypothetical protein